MADEIALMRCGKIVQSGSPYHVYTHPADRAAAAFFSDVNVVGGQVRGALVESIFGAFLAPGLADGTQVDVVFRPQYVHLDFDRNGQGPAPSRSHGNAARAFVRRARFMGTESLVEFRLEANDTPITALMRSVFLPEPGTPMWLSVRRERCFIFPKGQEMA